MAGRHCLLEAKFRELLPCAGFVRLGSEQWPISFTPSPKTATSSRWMISFFFSRCRRSRFSRNFGPRHCGIIVGSVVVWLLLAGFSRRGILLL